MTSWTLRFLLDGQQDRPILVHVSPKRGGHDLDLDLLATDGDSAFRGKVRERSLDKLRASSYEGSPEEWSSVLHFALHLGTQVVDLPDAIRDNIEVACSRTGKASKSVLNLLFRSRVEDITHKLGSIELQFSDNTDDVDLFGWSAQAVAQRDELSIAQREKHLELEKTRTLVTDLENQLAELLRAKKEHENELLSKFTLLLNEKKLRIRIQQRQIASQGKPGSAVDLGAADTASRTGKRRRLEPQPSEDESDGFEAMDMDAQHHDSDLGEKPTSDRHIERSDSDTEIDADEGAMGQNSLPPTRDLPFATTKQLSTNQTKRPDVSMSQPHENADDDETTSEDDEL